MLTIKIKLENKIIEIYLKNGRKVLDFMSFEEKNNLTEKLLPSVSEIIKKNKLEVKDIQKISIKSDLGEPYTSYRILKTVEKTFNFFK
jgi:tRNA A37 threonylcarbamoyladenosine modification protein TsaB